MIDRIEPTRRPNLRPRGYQQWRSLLFMHWSIPVEILRPLVPEPLELDLYQGSAYVGIVPFVMLRVRPWWLPASMGFDFLETNVRTYVHLNGRPGVFFFSLDAASAVAVWAARKCWGLPYFHAEMQYEFNENVGSYQSMRGGTPVRFETQYRVGPRVADSKPGSIEFFFLERYLMFVEGHRQIHSGQVHHSPYPVHSAEVLNVHDGLLSAAGLNGVASFPEFVHYSTGVDVEIFKLHAVEGTETRRA